jgi:hypothetical protein
MSANDLQKINKCKSPVYTTVNIFTKRNNIADKSNIRRDEKMIETDQKLYFESEKRVADAIALREPTAVPVAAIIQGYPIIDAGYKFKDAIYDFDIASKSVLRFAKLYQPDIVWGHDSAHFGKGPILEKIQPTNIEWAGKPGGRISDNSVFQFIEFPILQNEEIDFFNHDYSGWLIRSGLPRVSKTLEPLSALNSLEEGPWYDISALAAEWSAPEFRKMIHTLWEINDMNNVIAGKQEELETELHANGFLTPVKGYASVPMDNYSNFFRGTIDGLADMYENSETVEYFCDRYIKYALESIRIQGQYFQGKWVVMYLTKGLDTFMNTECYAKFYWKYLQPIITEIIANGMTPFIYTEGGYNSRLEFLKEVPRGVIYHFEDVVDMKLAKKTLGKTACIVGGFPTSLLLHGTKQQIIDKCKQLIDDCAAGGGYIFETSSGFDECNRENVEAMFQTALEYGKK